MGSDRGWTAPGLQQKDPHRRLLQCPAQVADEAEVGSLPCLADIDRDEGADTLAIAHKAVLDQIVQRPAHGDAGNRELPAERLLRRQPLPQPIAAAGDLLLEQDIELAMQ